MDQEITSLGDQELYGFETPNIFCSPELLISCLVPSAMARNQRGAMRSAGFGGLCRLSSAPAVVVKYFASMFGRSQAGSALRSRMYFRKLDAT